MSKLTRFAYTPEGQEAAVAVSFDLRPLTQPQMVDVEEHYTDGKPGLKAQYVAGQLGIVAVRGATHPETGQPARVPECFSWLDRGLVRLCGLRLIYNDLGLDWDTVVAGNVQPDDEGVDPAKN